jgi:hypothetical protein
MSPGIGDNVTLGEARAWLRKRAEEGATCPCCTQFAKVYKRKLNSGMARSLIAMFVIKGTDWVHIPTELSARSREEGKLAYWGLVEESVEPRDDGGRAGWWRVTPAGRRFVLRETRVPKYARIYDGRRLSLTGEPVSIMDALGDKFDYNELMGRSTDEGP